MKKTKEDRRNKEVYFVWFDGSYKGKAKLLIWPSPYMFLSRSDFISTASLSILYKGCGASTSSVIFSFGEGMHPIEPRDDVSASAILNG